MGLADLRATISSRCLQNALTTQRHELRPSLRHYTHYWLLDPDAGTLRVLRWTADGYLEVLSATSEETVQAEPFEAIALSLKAVLDIP